MDRSAEVLRRAVEALRKDEARERVARYRGDPDADDHVTVAMRHRWLGGPEARDALGELNERGRMPAPEAGATATHAVGQVREAALASVRDTLGGFVDRPLDVEGHAMPFAAVVAELYRGAPPARTHALANALVAAAARARGPILEAVARADEGARPWCALAALDPDRPTELATRERIEGILSRTRDLRDEALDWLFHRARREPSFESLPFALRAADLDDAFPRSTRLPRASAMLACFGAARELAVRVRVEPSHGGVDPRVRLAIASVPGPVHLAPSRIELGLLSELAMLDAVGRAWSIAWTHPALPPALARPREGTVGRALGTLLVRLATSRETLARQRRWPTQVQDQARRLAATVTLLSLRVAAVAASAERTASPEAAEASLREALGIRVPTPLAELLLRAPRGGAARLEGHLVGLSLFDVLRERFDEDFERNPRTAEALRGALERGASVGARPLLLELGGREPDEGSLATWFLGR